MVRDKRIDEDIVACMKGTAVSFDAKMKCDELGYGLV